MCFFFQAPIYTSSQQEPSEYGNNNNTVGSSSTSLCSRCQSGEAVNFLSLIVYCFSKCVGVGGGGEGTPPCFFCHFSKRNSFHDFLFASLDKVAFPIGVSSLSKEFAPPGANSFL